MSDTYASRKPDPQAPEDGCSLLQAEDRPQGGGSPAGRLEDVEKVVRFLEDRIRLLERIVDELLEEEGVAWVVSGPTLD